MDYIELTKIYYINDNEYDLHYKHRDKSYHITINSLFLPSFINNIKVTHISKYFTFYCKDKIHGVLCMPRYLQVIGEYAFSGCSKLTHVIIYDDVNTIGKYAFENCKSLVYVHLSENSHYHTISEGLFKNCIHLKDINIPKNIQKIDSYAFYNCKSVLGDLILDQVEIISEHAFENCGEKDSILMIGKSCRKIGGYAFVGVPRSKIIIHSKDIQINFDSFDITTMENAVGICHRESDADVCFQWFNSTIIYLDTIDITNYENEYIELSNLEDCGYGKSYRLQYYINKQVNYEGALITAVKLKKEIISQEEFKIPSYINNIPIKAIKRYFLKDSPHLTGDLIIPDSIEYIGDEAFSDSYFTDQLRLPNNINYVSINKNAFAYSHFTGDLIIPDNILLIEEGAFEGCSGFNRLVIGKYCKSIDAYAFKGCHFKSIVSYSLDVDIDRFAFDEDNINIEYRED